MSDVGLWRIQAIAGEAIKNERRRIVEWLRADVPRDTDVDDIAAQIEEWIS